MCPWKVCDPNESCHHREPARDERVAVLLGGVYTTAMYRGRLETRYGVLAIIEREDDEGFLREVHPSRIRGLGFCE